MYTSDNDIFHIAHGLRDRTLPKPEWTHNAHFAAAVWLIRSPLHDAERDMPDMIRRYNLACGVANTDTEGYHETITLASIRMASHTLKGCEALSLHDAVNHVLTSGLGRSDWIFRYWSKPVLFTPEARRSWVEPDVEALPVYAAGPK